MAYDYLRDAAREANLLAHGVSITVTRSTPDADPVTTTGIWSDALAEGQPFGSSFKRLEPRKVMAIPLSASLPNIPSGSFVDAAELFVDAPERRWVVDGLAERQAPDWAFVILKPLHEPELTT